MNNHVILNVDGAEQTVAADATVRDVCEQFAETGNQPFCWAGDKVVKTSMDTPVQELPDTAQVLYDPELVTIARSHGANPDPEGPGDSS